MLPLAAMASQTAQDAPFHPEIRSRDSSQTPPPVVSGQQLSSINEAKSLVDLSALLIDEKTAQIGRSASSSPVPHLAESDTASVSTRASSFYYDDSEDSESTTSNRSTSAISKRPLPVRTLSPSPPPPLSSISKRPLPIAADTFTAAVPPRLPLHWRGRRGGTAAPPVGILRPHHMDRARRIRFRPIPLHRVHVAQARRRAHTAQPHDGDLRDGPSRCRGGTAPAANEGAGGAAGGTVAEISAADRDRPGRGRCGQPGTGLVSKEPFAQHIICILVYICAWRCAEICIYTVRNTHSVN